MHTLFIARFLKHLFKESAVSLEPGRAESAASGPLHEKKRDGCELFTWCLLRPPVSSSLISSLHVPLIYTTVLRFEVSSTRKRCTSMLRFHSGDRFVVSSTVHAQSLVPVWSCFGRILSDSSHTIDCLKFPLTNNLISPFCTTFVLQVFCFDDRRREDLYISHGCTYGYVYCDLRHCLIIPLVGVVSLGLFSRILLR
jgi:hypothetical protein